MSSLPPLLEDCFGWCLRRRRQWKQKWDGRRDAQQRPGDRWQHPQQQPLLSADAQQDCCEGLEVAAFGHGRYYTTPMNSGSSLEGCRPPGCPADSQGADYFFPHHHQPPAGYHRPGNELEDSGGGSSGMRTWQQGYQPLMQSSLADSSVNGGGVASSMLASHPSDWNGHHGQLQSSSAEGALSGSGSHTPAQLRAALLLQELQRARMAAAGGDVSSATAAAPSSSGLAASHAGIAGRLEPSATAAAGDDEDDNDDDDLFQHLAADDLLDFAELADQGFSSGMYDAYEAALQSSLTAAPPASSSAGQPLDIAAHQQPWMSGVEPGLVAPAATGRILWRSPSGRGILAPPSSSRPGVPSIVEATEAEPPQPAAAAWPPAAAADRAAEQMMAARSPPAPNRQPRMYHPFTQHPKGQPMSHASLYAPLAAAAASGGSLASWQSPAASPYPSPPVVVAPLAAALGQFQSAAARPPPAAAAAAAMAVPGGGPAPAAAAGRRHSELQLQPDGSVSVAEVAAAAASNPRAILSLSAGASPDGCSPLATGKPNQSYQAKAPAAPLPPKRSSSLRSSNNSNSAGGGGAGRLLHSLSASRASRPSSAIELKPAAPNPLLGTGHLLQAGCFVQPRPGVSEPGEASTP